MATTTLPPTNTNRFWSLISPKMEEFVYSTETQPGNIAENGMCSLEKKPESIGPNYSSDRVCSMLALLNMILSLVYV